MKGVLDTDYHIGRINRIDYKYRLERRGREVIRAIKNFTTDSNIKILDVGTADGLMLSRIKDSFPQSECVGIEYAKELIDTNQDKRIKIIIGDAQNLSFASGSFNVIIAAAIIEHLGCPIFFIKKAYEILKNDGLLIITTPNPIYEKIALACGGFHHDEHQHVYTIKNLNELLTANKFKVLLNKRFMLSPVGFPAEDIIEKFLSTLNLDILLLNQLVVAKK